MSFMKNRKSFGWPWEKIRLFEIIGTHSQRSYGVWPGRGKTQELAAMRAFIQMALVCGKVAHNKGDTKLLLDDKCIAMTSGDWIIRPVEDHEVDIEESIRDREKPSWVYVRGKLIKNLQITGNSFLFDWPGAGPIPCL